MASDIKACKECGKDLLWGVLPWPVETAPVPIECSSGRAYVFARRAGSIIALDIRDLIDPPGLVYPQHYCRVWHERAAAARLKRSRADEILRRMMR